MRLFTFFLATSFFWGCATSNNISENDQVAVCGKISGEKQTYPTLGDLHNDGAKFLHYGPCY